MTFEQLILLGSILILMSIIMSKTSYRLGIPSLLFFLLIGILAGSEGIGRIYFDNPDITQYVGTFALIIILFSGGLDTKWSDVRPILWRGLTLSTLGVFITAIAVGLFINLAFKLPLLFSLLIGSIISSTDAAAIFSIFRSKKEGLKNNIEPTLELESGSNDPMAYFLTTTFIFLILNPTTSIEAMILLLIQSLGLGVIFGVIFGKIIVKLINNINLNIAGLYLVLTITLAFLTYSATYLVGGNGFLSVYIAALILGNNSFVQKTIQVPFFDGIAWLMQISMFLILGLLVFPSQIIPVIGIGVLISFFLILVARPIAVFLCLLPFKVGLKDQLLISWVGIKGAVPIILATFPIVAGIEGADMIFNIVFFITITSALIQGSTINLFARYLGLSIKESEKK
ncbi:potassium/proton antiporter [Methanobacterium alkalithermotolerans]|uniref:Potassium/proton antiporter n=1 Tax=Methanobacterium alkalithermotolerans TaxID=2731220 RepID=A0A8T8K5J2_9EURY|nr:potassium/proton antiporter [Methanobacterium alkalithermotolerans]QUH22765.1 potassium/proton antiporter [Methanobacterium alkalithermotolerans]